MATLSCRHWILPTVLIMAAGISTTAADPLFLSNGQAIGSTNSFDVALTDIDGDNDLDAVVVNCGPDSVVWLNDGSGQFSLSEHTFSTACSVSLDVGDLDGDGDVDAFVGNCLEPNEVWFNDGTGVFVDSGQALGGNTHTTRVDLGDVDGDGDLDIAVTNMSVNGVNYPAEIWINNGSGYFADSGQDFGELVQDVEFADVDSDGDLDLFATNLLLNPVPQHNRLWINDGNGLFTDSGQNLGSHWANGVATGDLDNDGDIDVVFSDTNGGDYLWLNDGGVFTETPQRLAQTPNEDCELGDFDLDGDLDIIALNEDGPNPIWLNDGAAFFTDSGETLGGEDETIGAAVGDVDGDGDPDLFVANCSSLNAVWINQTRNNDCSFDPEETIVVTREKGKPRTDWFGWESCGGSGYLLITNSRATSAHVYLNDELVLSPCDLGHSVTHVLVEIDLPEGANQLTVRLRGKPGTSLSFDFSVDAPAPW